MKKSWLVPGLVALLFGSMVASLPACSPSSSADDPDGSAGTSGNSGGGSDSTHASGGDGSAGLPDSAGGSDSSGPSGEGGEPGAAGSVGVGDGGEPGVGSGDALPASTFLYVYSQTPDVDLLVALDVATGEERVVTDLRGDGSQGWEIWGHTISPDRRRIAVASLFDPTSADNATQLATRRIWTFAPDGSDFQRLTPVFENTGAGRKNFEITVQDPVYNLDGSAIIYDFGNWWYESTTLQGGSAPWFVSTSGEDLPELFPISASCTVVDPSINPATGEVLLVHSVCVSSADEGIYLYPPDGGEPTKLVNKGYGPNGVDPALQKASWLGDGSAFVFVGTIEVDRAGQIETANSLLYYDMETAEIGVLVIPDSGANVRNATISPDGSVIIYCLAHDGGLDLHAVDLTLDPPEEAPITNDGKSCDPSF